MGKKTRAAPRRARDDPKPVERYEDTVDSDEERIVAETNAQNASDDENEEDKDASAASAVEPETAPKRETVYNAEGMEQRTTDLELGLPFVETFVVSTDPVGEVNPEDDLKREVLFYRQALDAVKAGREKMEEAGVNHQRPEDFFAEMVKSDQHMARIKQRLLFEKQKMDAFEQRKKQQDYKKFAKQLQSEKLKEKSVKKKQAVKDAKDLKGIVDESGEILRSAAGAGGKRKRDEKDDGGRGGSRGGRGGGRGDREGGEKMGRKRQAKNEQYGSGGKKRDDKRNSKESSNDFSDYSQMRNKAPVPGMGGGRGGGRGGSRGGSRGGRGGSRGGRGGKGASRPGKSTRMGGRGGGGGGRGGGGRR